MAINTRSLSICNRCRKPCNEDHSDTDSSVEEENAQSRIPDDNEDSDDSDDSEYNTDDFSVDLSDDEDEDEDSSSIEDIDEEELYGLAQDLLEETLDLGFNYRVV